jgi:two-component system NtrC family sensor kinase
MRLALRFVLIAAPPLALVIILNGLLRVDREVELISDEIASHQVAMGRALSAPVERALIEGGDAAVRALLASAAAREDRVQLSWLARSDARFPALPEQTRADLAGDVAVVPSAPSMDGAFTTYVPVITASGLRGAVVLSEALTRERAYLNETVVRIGGLTLVAVAAMALSIALMGWLVMGRRARHLLTLVRAVDGDELGRPLQTGPTLMRDELDTVAAAIVDVHRSLIDARADAKAAMLAKVHAVEQLRHADRLSTVGQLASGMAHEIGTPLNVILGRATMLQRPRSDAERQRDLDAIVHQVDRISGIIQNVLRFSRREHPAHGRVDLFRLSEQSVAMLKPLAKRAGVTLHVDGETTWCTGDGLQLDQVLTNLVVNAVHASSAGGEVWVTVDRRPEVDTAQLTVRDTGGGMPPEVQRRAFDPFFTTKDVGEGTGLGLSVTLGIVHEHGGEIDIRSAPGEGTTVVVTLPLSAAAS